jgi:hypothetical protein
MEAEGGEQMILGTQPDDLQLLSLGDFRVPIGGAIPLYKTYTSA